MGNPFSNSAGGGGFQGSTMQQGLASMGNAFGPNASQGMNQGVSSGQNPLMSLFQRMVGPNGKQVQGDMNDIYDITKSSSVAPAPKITPLSLDSPDVNSWGQS